MEDDKESGEGIGTTEPGDVQDKLKQAAMEQRQRDIAAREYAIAQQATIGGLGALNAPFVAPFSGGDFYLRERCLTAAVQFSTPGTDHEKIIAKAQAFYDFVTAKPSSAPDLRVVK